MPDRINRHEFGEYSGICVHCNATTTQGEATSCVWRDAPPRAVPQSVFADLTQIGDRMTEIRRAEGREGENA